MAPGLTPEQFVQRAQARTAQCGELCRYAEFSDYTNLLPSTVRNVLVLTLHTAGRAFIADHSLRLCFPCESTTASKVPRN